MKDRIQVMTDLETFGSKSPKSVIVAIGAVAMDMQTLQLVDGPKFYANVSAASCQKQGLEVEGDTVMWWLKQSDHARAKLNTIEFPALDLPVALGRFTDWCRAIGDPDGTPMWGNGSDFDCVLLRNAYNACSFPAPWKYHQTRCYRTLKNIVSDEALRPAPNDKAHDALADAEWQAQHLFAIYRHLREYGVVETPA